MEQNNDSTGEWKEWARFVLNELKETKQDIKNICDHIDRHAMILDKNTQYLDEHMKRTEQVEETNKILAKKIDAIEKERTEKVAVAQYKNDVAVAIAKIFGGLALVTGLVYSIFQIIDWLKAK